MYYGVSFPLCEETHLEVPKKPVSPQVRSQKKGPKNGAIVLPQLYLAVYPCFSPRRLCAVRCSWQLVQ